MIRKIRQLHLYLGTFFAPAILFFAFTGALQTLSLHEATQGSSYHPPAWVERLAQIHKKQTAELPQRRPPSAQRADRRPEGMPPPGPPPPAKSTWALKAFVFIMSIGLITTTLLGIYMAFKFNRDQRLIWGLLILGTVIPVAFILL